MISLLHRYILIIFLRNLLLAAIGFTALFLIVDFFDRIDNILGEKAHFTLVAQYFLLKIPFFLNVVLPISCLVATLFTLGMLSRNSELIAMRAAGCKILWLSLPLLIVSLLTAFFSLILSETAVPYSNRRVREIYNIDIKQKDKRGGYSRSNFWWRKGSFFYSVGQFDSRNNSLDGVTSFEISDDFKPLKRIEAEKASFLDPLLGWNMRSVTEYQFDKNHRVIQSDSLSTLPLPIKKKPEDFYARQTDPASLSFRELKRFIREQRQNGVPISGYLADLNDKLAFPFICLIVSALAIPFTLKTSRQGGTAINFLFGLIIGFSYYVVHSFSISLGRAEVWHPLLAAWLANIVMATIAVILNASVETPT
ncbi:MAG TPA: LPS export ABC transporter permease LptG [Oligoflexia bacterium]|nr:LPS export ABC transporter permease LptG [Oligoflexia bacterium]HMP27170.1 LPS export ABC transporter permease LptG [Oligoflexia bacterium]